jgi:hypothetical protein
LNFWLFFILNLLKFVCFFLNFFAIFFSFFWFFFHFFDFFNFLSLDFWLKSCMLLSRGPHSSSNRSQLVVWNLVRALDRKLKFWNFEFFWEFFFQNSTQTTNGGFLNMKKFLLDLLVSSEGSVYVYFRVVVSVSPQFPFKFFKIGQFLPKVRFWAMNWANFVRKVPQLYPIKLYKLESTASYFFKPRKSSKQPYFGENR